MVQVYVGRLDEVPEFESPVVLFQPWLTLITESATSVELNAVEHVVSAMSLERGAYHKATLAFSWLQHGEAQAAIDWFRLMAGDIEHSSWHWGQAAMWLKEHGVEEQARVYASLYPCVAAQQHRLNLLVERIQGQVTRYCQEWGIVLPLASEEDEGAGHGTSGTVD